MRFFRALILFSLAALSAHAATVTFSKDIAPILFKECATCHRAGHAGPFELLTYEDAQKHARDIARVTAKRITCPPGFPNTATANSSANAA